MGEKTSKKSDAGRTGRAWRGGPEGEWSATIGTGRLLQLALGAI